MDWAREGQGVAEMVSYVGIALNSTPSTSYLNTAQTTTEHRVALGPTAWLIYSLPSSLQFPSGSTPSSAPRAILVSHGTPFPAKPITSNGINAPTRLGTT